MRRGTIGNESGEGRDMREGKVKEVMGLEGVERREVREVLRN